MISSKSTVSFMRQQRSEGASGLSQRSMDTRRRPTVGWTLSGRRLLTPLLVLLQKWPRPFSVQFTRKPRGQPREHRCETIWLECPRRCESAYPVLVGLVSARQWAPFPPVRFILSAHHLGRGTIMRVRYSLTATWSFLSRSSRLRDSRRGRWRTGRYRHCRYRTWQAEPFTRRRHPHCASHARGSIRNARPRRRLAKSPRANQGRHPPSSPVRRPISLLAQQLPGALAHWLRRTRRQRQIR
jgi:hypothetical protein